MPQQICKFQNLFQLFPNIFHNSINKVKRQYKIQEASDNANSRKVNISGVFKKMLECRRKFLEPKIPDKINATKIAQISSPTPELNIGFEKLFFQNLPDFNIEIRGIGVEIFVRFL